MLLLVSSFFLGHPGHSHGFSYYPYYSRSCTSESLFWLRHLSNWLADTGTSSSMGAIPFSASGPDNPSNSLQLVQSTSWLPQLGSESPSSLTLSTIMWQLLSLNLMIFFFNIFLMVFPLLLSSGHDFSLLGVPYPVPSAWITLILLLLLLICFCF